MGQRIALFLGLLTGLISSNTLATVPLQSAYDERSIETLTLPNHLKVLLISDPDANKAAVSLDVAVGSGANPENFLGLAHFVEHMLFLGTTAYPEVDAYQTYIQTHGGSHNAFTAYENTNYFFDIQPEHLPGALARFSRFFVDPLFSPDYIHREKLAVESEFKLSRNDDRRRIHEATKQIMNPEHGWSRFAVGNLQTLQDQETLSLEQAVIDFYHRYYSANNMSLVISGPQSLDSLKEWATTYFADIPDRQVQRYVDNVPLLLEDQLPLRLDIQTLRQMRQVSLVFPVDPVKPHWRSKPLYFISSLLGYEGKGSLLSALKAQNLATSLSSYTSINLDKQAAFQIDLTLTTAGIEQLDRIIDLIFSYLRLIESEGIDADLYAEMAHLAEIDFRYREQVPAVREVIRLAQMQHQFPAENLFNAFYLFEDFNAELIKHTVQQLTPDNLLLIVQQKDALTDQREPFYDVGYQYEALDITQWQQPSLASDNNLSIRTLNPFVPNVLSIKETESDDLPFPTRLDAQTYANIELWHQQDTTFLRPKANVYIGFFSPSANSQPEHRLLLELYTRMVQDQLNETLYDASLAGLDVSIYTHLRGFTVHLSGYNDKQTLLADYVANALANLEISQERFSRTLNQLRDNLSNQKKDPPNRQALQHLYTELLSYWSLETRQHALENITLADVSAFISEFYRQLHVRMLVHGNHTKGEAQSLAHVFQRQLLPHTDIRSDVPIHVKVLTEPSQRHDRLTFDHSDAVVLRYMQSPDSDLHHRVTAALLADILATPFFTELRTEKQLGYLVSASYLPLSDHPGVLLMVQSPSASAEEVSTHIDTFMHTFADTLTSLDAERFEQFRAGLLSKILQPPTQLAELSRQYWQALDTQEGFENIALTAAALQAISLNDVIEYWQRMQLRRFDILSSSPEP